MKKVGPSVNQSLPTSKYESPLKGNALMKSSFLIAAMLGGLIQLAGLSVRADETCSSPYLTRIEGQEEFLYVWTLGVEGLGDSSDKLVVVDVKPGSSTYGQ